MTTLGNKTTDPRRKTIDPVCGMDVVPGKTKLVSIHRGTSYWFCTEGCRTAFETNPDKYLKSGPGKKKGCLDGIWNAWPKSIRRSSVVQVPNATEKVHGDGESLSNSHPWCGSIPYLLSKLRVGYECRRDQETDGFHPGTGMDPRNPYVITPQEATSRIMLVLSGRDKNR